MQVFKSTVEVIYHKVWMTVHTWKLETHLVLVGLFLRKVCCSLTEN